MAATSSPYGVFHLGAMQMALHLDALREVVPLGRPMAMPCGNPAVLGGVDLRGVLVPVLDLRRQLVQPAHGDPSNVVIMRHGDHLLGLLVEQVTGVFDCPEPQQHPIDTTAGHLTLLKGSFPHPENGSLICVLDPAHLMALPDLPLAREPQGSGATAASDDEAAAAPQTAYVLLTRSAGLRLALPSRVVHSTVLNPEVRPSALSGGYCSGTIDVAGTQVAAIDLAALCGMARDAPGARRQAFVVSYAGGLLAFLVDAIADVIPADLHAALPLPRTTLPRPDLFTGLLPMASLKIGTCADPDGFYLLLDDQRLVELPELVGYAHLNTGTALRQAPGAPAPDPADTTEGTSAMPGKVLTFDLGESHAASPIEQVSEIVPWSRGTPLFAHGGPALGLIVNRGRAIPTYSLAALLGRPAPPPAADASVLVVEHGAEAVGFAVLRLIGIDEVDWMPQQDRLRLDARQHDPAPAGGEWQARVLVADGQGQRMLNLLDLRQLARGLLQPSP